MNPEPHWPTPEPAKRRFVFEVPAETTDARIEYRRLNKGLGFRAGIATYTIPYFGYCRLSRCNEEGQCHESDVLVLEDDAALGRTGRRREPGNGSTMLWLS